MQNLDRKSNMANQGVTHSQWICFGKTYQKWTTVQLFTTACLYLEVIGWGFFHGIIGPTILDIELKTETSTSQVTLAITVMNSCALLGAFLTGLTLDRVNARIFMSIVLICHGIMVIMMPWAFNYVSLLVIFGITGLFAGLVDTGQNVTATLTWGWEGYVFLQVFHALFAVGTFISPFIARPFLAVPLEGSTNLSILESYTDQPVTPELPAENSTNSFETQWTNTNIEISYLIVGSYIVLTGVLFILCYWHFRKTRKDNKKPESKGRSTTKNQLPPDYNINKVYQVIMTILMFFRFAFDVAIEVTFPYLVVVFVVKGLNWSKFDGVKLTVVLRACYASARVLFIFIAFILTPTKVLCLELSLCAAAFTTMVIAVWYHPMVMWVCTGVAGVGMASIYSSTMSWSSRYMHINGKYGSVFLCGSWTGLLSMPAISGYLFDAVGPQSFVYVCFGVVSCLVIFYIISTFIAYKWGPKYGTENEVINGETEKEVSIPLNEKE